MDITNYQLKEISRRMCKGKEKHKEGLGG